MYRSFHVILEHKLYWNSLLEKQLNFQSQFYYTEEGESVRQAVNQWIRSGGAFDGVFDFDAAVRDPNHPGKFKEDLQSGDYLHPNAAGYKAMADAIDLSVLMRR